MLKEKYEYSTSPRKLEPNYKSHNKENIKPATEENQR